MEAQIKELIERYMELIAVTENYLDDDGKLPQGTYNELQCELSCYVAFTQELSNILDENITHTRGTR